MAADVDAAIDFLRQHGRCVLVTLRRDGRPQLSNVFAVAGKDGIVRISVTDSRAKTKNLRRDPRASIHTSAGDFWSYAVIDGTVELSPVAQHPDDATVDELVAVYREGSGEHPDWEEFRQAMVDERRLVVRFRPERAYGALPG